MEIDLSIGCKQKIEVGDVVVDSYNTAYLLTKNSKFDKTHPYAFVNLDTFCIENSFASLEFINREKYVISGRLIREVVKSSKLKLSLREGEM